MTIFIQTMLLLATSVILFWTSTAVLCPTTTQNLKVNATECDRRIYSDCPFTCNQGFDRNPKYEGDTIFCYGDGTWNDFGEPACIERRGVCINYLENGKWANGCQFLANETCAFECNGGFKKNQDIKKNITCQPSAEWDADLNILCKENDHGLIVTITEKFRATSDHILTVPTAPDGKPSMDYVRSLPLPRDFRFLSVGGDFTLRHAYMYDYQSNAIYKNSNFSIGTSTPHNWTTYHRGISKAYVKLSVDWISHNIYWTDPQYKWIVVQSLLSNDSSMYRVLLHENLEGPHALTLDPMEALLFWSDIGIRTKIEVSSLSGKNRKALIFSNLEKPYSLAADYVTKRIYFVDAGRYVVETATYEGQGRKVLLKKSYSSLFDIAVYKDYLYVTNGYNALLYSVNKTNGQELLKSEPKSGVTYYGVTVFHPDAQPISDTAHCVNYGCEHICVTEKDGATCLCKEGYRLNQDMKTCSSSNEYLHRGLMFSNKSSVCVVDVRVITHFSYKPKCILGSNGTKYMILDTDERRIILANDTAIYWTNVDNPELHHLTEPSGTISGMAWDGYDRNVYWTEKDTGIIWRMSIDSKTAQVFLEGLNKPRDILILPQDRLVYWISDKNGSTIESSNLEGSNIRVILDSNVLKNPKSLSFDQYTKRIYFLDTYTEGYSYVYCCRLDGTSRNTFLRTYTTETLGIYKGHLLVTSKFDASSTLITSFSISDYTNTSYGVFPDTGIISVIKVFDETIRQNETGPCYNLNGDCEQICISNGKTRTCECAFGFKVGRNGKACTSDPIDDNFMLVSASTDNNIYQISLKDKSVQGIKTKGEKTLKKAIYNPVHSRVISSTIDSEISILQLDGTVDKKFPMVNMDDNHQYLSKFAVDYSTGNIYYTVMKVVSDYSSRNSVLGVLSPNGLLRDLITDLYYPNGLALYPSKGLLFYIDRTFQTHISQANMDGSNQSVILFLPNGIHSDLIIDYKNDYLYWIDSWNNGIHSCKLDGTGYRKFFDQHETHISDLDIYQGYLYVSTPHWITKVKISNPNETTQFAAYDELGRLLSISIYSSTFENKNAFCSIDNGGCSTFCFPTPDGGKCGCENDVDFIDGSDKFCSNIPRCPEILNHINVAADCLRVNGSKCRFTCQEGYQVKQGVDQVICNSIGYTPSDACKEITCPATLANGKWVNCSFSVKKKCEYTCDYGYTKNDAITEVECQINGNWNSVNTDKLCKAITCPDQFIHGKIVSTCERRVGQTCAYECTGYGYKKNESILTIECTESGTWNRDTVSLCEQIHCPTEIPNGALRNGSNGQKCSTAIGTRCEFKCNSGFVKGNEVQSLYCLLEGWTADLHKLCTVPAEALSAKLSEAHLAAIGVGVTIGGIIVIVLILVILRRNRLHSQFVPKRIKEEVLPGQDMYMSFDPAENVRVSYENGVVDIIGHNKNEDPTKVYMSSINTGR
ncbi:hypothetical protein ACJMK2_015336 [Sinanodonta woodiana]|uniref:Sushi domain-containing protein n=1 Tax=Sinanodonta woodiana TaxID=1069815 RepID=A0ABD3UPZ3_SINWO